MGGLAGIGFAHEELAGDTAEMRGERAHDLGRRRRVRIVVSILSASALLVACAKAFELRVNWTESMPRGLYQRVDPALVRGESVAVCLEGEAARIARETR